MVRQSGVLFCSVNGLSPSTSIPAKTSLSLTLHSSLLPQHRTCKHRVERKSNPPGAINKIYQITVLIWRDRGGPWQKWLLLPKIDWNSIRSSRRSKEVSPISTHTHTLLSPLICPSFHLSFCLACTTQTWHVQTCSSFKDETLNFLSVKQYQCNDPVTLGDYFMMFSPLSKHLQNITLTHLDVNKLYSNVRLDCFKIVFLQYI